MRKFKCVKDCYCLGDRMLKKGEIYPEKDGYVVDDEGCEIRPENYEHYLIEIKDEPEPTKPPLGLKPRYIHSQNRKEDILRAMLRYTEAGKAIPEEWINELDELNGGEI